MKIGIFDSGVGGLSVLYQAMRALPEEEFLYYADEAHVPYGEKTKKQIMEYVDEAARFMADRGVKAIVLACNTATSVAVGALRGKYPIPVIGMEPAVKKAVEYCGEKRVFVTATPITIKGDKLRFLIENVDQRHLADLIPLPGLVRFAERGEFESEAVREYIGREFGGYDMDNYSSLVLGCTHFNYFKDSFRRVLPDTIRFVDGNEGTVRQLIRRLSAHGALEHGRQSVDFYFSGVKVTEERELARLSGLLRRLGRMYEVT